MSNTKSPEHSDYADAAESAERGYAWAQASALWQMANNLCDAPDRQATYRDGVARCDAEAAIERELAAIARRVMQVPTLETRKADHLDFHEVAVWSLREALRIAYRMGREAP